MQRKLHFQVLNPDPIVILFVTHKLHKRLLSASRITEMQKNTLQGKSLFQHHEQIMPLCFYFLFRKSSWNKDPSNLDDEICSRKLVFWKFDVKYIILLEKKLLAKLFSGMK